jgi:hypothetical protein
MPLAEDLSVIWKKTKIQISNFARGAFQKIENFRRKENCVHCCFFINSNRVLCEKLNLVHNSISTEVRLRLGYGICVVRGKMVRRGAKICNDYRDLSRF